MMQGEEGLRVRNELKYVCNDIQLALLAGRMKALCRQDSHVNSEGKYNIRSVYFDDYDNTCLYENENGVNPRRKYRIRIYNHSAGYITLERKSKIGDKTHKESCGISKEQCEALLGGWCMWRNVGELPVLLQELYVEYRTKLLRPKIIVEYERTPFLYREGNVRVTFDRNISSSRDCRLFLREDIRRRPVMPEGKHVLEVKFDEFLPDFIYNALQIRDLHQTAYSKYYMCRKYS